MHTHTPTGQGSGPLGLGTQVVPIALADALDGKHTEDYHQSARQHSTQCTLSTRALLVVAQSIIIASI